MLKLLKLVNPKKVNEFISREKSTQNQWKKLEHAKQTSEQQKG
jgi:hypothetical protein